MKLAEVLQHRREHLHYIAIYDEVTLLLERIANGDLEVPVASGDSTVDLEFVGVVSEQIAMAKKEHETAIVQIESMEFINGGSENEPGVADSKGQRPNRKGRRSRNRSV